MNSIWENLYDRVKDRRYGTFFLFALAGFFGLLILLAWAEQMGEPLAEQIAEKESLRIALAVAIVFFVVWVGALIWRVFSRRHERSNSSRMSSDELAKARSKLLKNQSGRGL